MAAELCLPPGADVRSWRAWLQQQEVAEDVKETLDFGLATVESCDFGMVLQAQAITRGGTTRHVVLFKHINQDSTACFGEGVSRVDLPQCPPTLPMPSHRPFRRQRL